MYDSRIEIRPSVNIFQFFFLFLLLVTLLFYFIYFFLSLSLSLFSLFIVLNGFNLKILFLARPFYLPLSNIFLSGAFPPGVHKRLLFAFLIELLFLFFTRKKKKKLKNIKILNLIFFFFFFFFLLSN